MTTNEKLHKATVKAQGCFQIQLRQMSRQHSHTCAYSFNMHNCNTGWQNAIWEHTQNKTLKRWTAKTKKQKH